jgi:hypothetical protein
MNRLVVLRTKGCFTDISWKTDIYINHIYRTWVRSSQRTQSFSRWRPTGYFRSGKQSELILRTIRITCSVWHITFSSSQPFLILVTYAWRRDLLEELIVAELVIKIFCHYATRIVVAVFTVAVWIWSALWHRVFNTFKILPSVSSSSFQLFHRPKCIVCTFKISPIRAPCLARLNWIRTLWWWLMKFVEALLSSWLVNTLAVVWLRSLGLIFWMIWRNALTDQKTLLRYSGSHKHNVLC